MIKVAQFIDDLLTKLYGLPAFYSDKTRDDLVGHLVIGLAPHTSAGVLARIVGFTRANVGYAHPFFHAAKRRNCFLWGYPEIEVSDGRQWRSIPIRNIRAGKFRYQPSRTRPDWYLLLRSRPSRLYQEC